MESDRTKPVIFLAFANDQDDRARYLRELAQEKRRVRSHLEQARSDGLCHFEIRSNATIDDILDVFQSRTFRDRIAVFHFGGHAGGYQLLLESARGRPQVAHADGLAAFLGQQTGLQLVFLNGCSTQPQVEGLLAANVPAVIATSEAIDDEMAMELSVRFYAGLAGGASIATAYEEAEGAVRTLGGGTPRGVVRSSNRGEREDHEPSAWPFNVYVRPGADSVKEWSLPLASGNPLFGLPSVPEVDLPESPFRHLDWFHPEDAAIFFGRGSEIRSIYDSIVSEVTSPIVLFYGKSGVGKSSLLAAGLLPRLTAIHDVRYVRRNRGRGLSRTLADELGAENLSRVRDAWCRLEESLGKPVDVILDQVEEVYTRPGEPNEITEFVEFLQSLFSDRSHRPHGKLVLSFRKEWLADIEERLREAKLPRFRFFLERLSRQGITEIVMGPTRSARLRQHFKLAVEDGLAEAIAQDLSQDYESPVAPTLQVLLSKLWDRRDEEAPFFSIEGYHDLKRKGLLLADFVSEQFEALLVWNPDVVNSGLALDVLAKHTTQLGTAEQQLRSELDLLYEHTADLLPALLQRCKDLYLLIETNHDSADASTRLAHDTLAPLIRKRFRESDKPGQRARRILESRAVDWSGGAEGSPMDETDLATVEAGRSGMRRWTADEQRLVEASQRRRTADFERRERSARFKRRMTYLISSIAVVCLSLAILAWRQTREAKNQTRIADAQRLSIQANELADSQLDLALLLAAEAYSLSQSVQSQTTLLDILRHQPGLTTFLWGHTSGITALDMGGQGMAISADRGGLIVVWDVDRGVAVDSLRVTSDPGTESQGCADSFFDVCRGSSSQINDLTFLPGGSSFATAHGDGSVVIWESQPDIVQTRTFQPGNVEVRSLAWSPDGRLLAAGMDDGRVVVWDLTAGYAIDTLDVGRGQISALEFDARGDRLVSGSISEGTVSLWRLSAGQFGRTWSTRLQSEVYDIAINPEDRLLAVASLSYGSLIDLSTGSTIDSVAGSFRSVEFDTRGRTLWAGGDDVIIRSHDGIRSLQAHTDRVNVISHHNGILLSGGEDGALVRWDPENEVVPAMKTLNHGEPVSGLVFGRDGIQLFTATVSGNVFAWDSGSAEKVGDFERRLSGYVRLELSRDGRYLAGGGCSNLGLMPVRDELYHVEPCQAEVFIWDTERRRTVGQIDGHSRRVGTLAFSPDGSQLLSGSLDSTVLLSTIPDGRALGRYDSLPGPVRGVGFIRGSDDIIVGTRPGHLIAFAGSRRGTPDSLGIHGARGSGDYGLQALDVSEDGRYLATSSDDIILWDLVSRTRLDTLSTTSGRPSTLSFSPDGKRLVSGHTSGVATLWDLETRLPIGDPLHGGHTAEILAVAFSPGGDRLATAGTDGKVTIWYVGADRWQHQACTIANRSFSQSESTTYLGRRTARGCAESSAETSSQQKMPRQ